MNARILPKAQRVIRAASGSFEDVGNALETIRDHRLYRAEYQDFDAYCTLVWDKCRSRVCRLIGAAQIMKYLRRRMLPTGNILPTSEWQVRPLLKLSRRNGRESVLDLETIGQAWQEVVRRAEIRPNRGRRITARLVQDVVRECLAADEPDRPSPQGKIDEVLSEVERLVNKAREKLPVKDWAMFAQGLRKMARKAEAVGI